jgi:hypothetical protein
MGRYHMVGFNHGDWKSRGVLMIYWLNFFAKTYSLGAEPEKLM